MHDRALKQGAVLLRRRGKTYREIREILQSDIPKSTLSEWCSGIKLSQKESNRISKFVEINLAKARIRAIQTKRVKRIQYFESINKRIEYLPKLLHDKDTAKIVVAALYLGEGAKTKGGHVMLGNSNPALISLFLKLLRYSYFLDEKKFRCTLQCRADQKIRELEKFWSNTTNVPLTQFYKARIDPRTIGKPSRKPDYKGVCRIDYLSVGLAYEITMLGEVICKTGR